MELFPGWPVRTGRSATWNFGALTVLPPWQGWQGATYEHSDQCADHVFGYHSRPLSGEYVATRRPRKTHRARHRHRDRHHLDVEIPRRLLTPATAFPYDHARDNEAC